MKARDDGRPAPIVEGAAGSHRGNGFDPIGTGRARRPLLKRIDLLPYALVIPLALFILGLALYPAGVTVVQAFYRVQALDPPVRFSGMDNFVRLFNDDAIVSSIGNTGLYVVVGVILSTILGIIAALTLQHRFAGRSILVAILILPWALPGVVAGIVWLGIWDSNTGLLNSVLTSFNLIDHYQVFLGQDRLVTIIAIELVQVWQMVPLSTLLILAAMQNIPTDLYEAARIDGCTSWALVRRITLPLARPGIAVAMVQAVIMTLNVFDQPYVLNGAAPTGASLTMQTYFVSFQNLDFGEGYALSLLITVATLFLSVFVVKLVYRKVEF